MWCIVHLLCKVHLFVNYKGGVQYTSGAVGQTYGHPNCVELPLTCIKPTIKRWKQAAVEALHPGNLVHSVRAGGGGII